MAITIDELKRNVFPGESGGDYNALFGYANRPGGQFSGVNLTDMTVDQALQFASPSGPYAASVRGQVGRTATPMGAYQVVGTTLRGAKEGLGLTGQERMTPQLQDAIGMWIYQNQGPGAWEAWGGGGGNVRKSSKGTGMGLLDMPAEQPQTFGQRVGEGLRSGSLMDSLALAFNSLRTNPDQNLAAVVGQRQEQRGEERAANRTAQWLASIGRDDLAQAMLAGSLDPKSAAAIAMTPAADNRTAMVQNYEYWLSQGKTPDEAAEMARAGAGGSVTNVNTGMKADEAFGVEAAKGQATMFNAMSQDAINARADIGRVDVIDQLLSTGIGGNVDAWKAFAKNNLGVNLGTGGAIEALDAAINQLVPSQRPPGSGTMSDRDVALFKSSLPQLLNSPQGNAIITQTMRGMAEYKIAQGEIANAILTGQLGRPEGMQMLQSLPDPMANVKQFIETQLGTETAPPPGSTILTPDDLRYLE